MTVVLDQPLSRTETIRRLRTLEPTLRAMGLRTLFLFGSVARDEGRTDGDIDVFAEFEPGAALGWDFAGAPDLMALKLDRSVDFTTRGALHPLLKADIESEAIRIF